MTNLEEVARTWRDRAVRLGEDRERAIECVRRFRGAKRALVAVTAELSEARPFQATRYRNLPILDLTAPTHAQLQEAVAFITDEVEKGSVYVHCKIGYSRSAAVVGGGGITAAAGGGAAAAF
jgi:protein-tyrosine phosphatase